MKNKLILWICVLILLVSSVFSETSIDKYMTGTGSYLQLGYYDHWAELQNRVNLTTADGLQITNVTFAIGKVNNPSGNCWVTIYSSTDADINLANDVTKVCNSSSVACNTFDATCGNGASLYNFTFENGACYSASWQDRYYALVLESDYSVPDTTNHACLSTTSGIQPNLYTYERGWADQASENAIFRYEVWAGAYSDPGDVTPPTITIEYPNGTYNETYNDYNGSIMFETNENATCGLNVTDWVLNSTNNSIFHFYNSNTSLADDFYSINISCNDTSNNSAWEDIHFTIDNIYPALTSIFDGNNTPVTHNITYWFNWTDNNIMWSANITINGTLIYNITNISNSSHYYTNDLNVTGWPYGDYLVSSTYCDAHTGEVLKQNWDTPVREGNTLSFDGLNITSYDNVDKMTYTDKIDRKSFCFEYAEPLSEIIIDLDEHLTYIDNPLYKGWFVDDKLKRWVDFEGAHDVRVIGHTIVITPDKPQDKYCFNSVGELNCITEDFIFHNRNRLIIGAKDIRANTNISTFYIYQNGTLKGNTTNETFTLDHLTNETHNISIDAPGYELKEVYFTSQNQTEYYNFSLYTTNSISIIIRDESVAGFPILNGTEVTMEFTTTNESFINTTSTGLFYVDNLTAGNWEVQFSALNYSDRTYSFNIFNRTHTTLTAYLALAQTTDFTITDYDSGEPLENVSIALSRVINSTWTIIDVYFTDITGRTRISFVDDVNYRFYNTKEGYDDLIFYLDPVLYDEYSIKMSKITSQENYGDYDRVSISYAPKIFLEGLNNFTMVFFSPYGELLSYGFNATYPGGSTNLTSNTDVGSDLNTILNITGVNFGDTLIIDYYYEHDTYGYKNFTAILPISYNGTGNQTTMITNKDKTYGLGIFERMLFVVVFIFVVVGIGTLIGRPLEAFAFGLFLFGLFVYIGFIPIWSVLISVLAGLIIISAKGGI